MINKQRASPEFLKAMEHYKAMLDQYGDDHPITQRAFMLVWEYSPQWLKDEMDEVITEHLPKPSGYLDNGEPVYNLADIAKHQGISLEEAEQNLLEMMQNREELGLSNDGLLVNDNVNRIQ